MSTYSITQEDIAEDAEIYGAPLPQVVTLSSDSAEVHGIDVSFWQGDNIDWEVAKQHIDFAFIRCAYGKTMDTCFERNAAECRRLGIPFGIYIYVLCKSNAGPQIDMLEQCYDAFVPPLGVWLDFESDGDLDKYALQNYVTKFANECDARFGRDSVGIYTRASWWDYELPRMDWPKYHRLWVAHYNSYVSDPDIPADWGEINNPKEWSFWQYSDKGNGSLYGISPLVSKSVDVNRFNGSYADFIAAFDLDAGVPSIPPVEPPLPPPPPPPADIILEVTAHALNGRSAPTSAADNVVLSLANGRRVKQVGVSGNWKQVEVRETVWMYGTYLKEVE